MSSSTPATVETRRQRGARDRARGGLDGAIIETVAYADVFDYPLTVDELHRYLIGVAASRGTVRAAVGSLTSPGRVLTRSGKYITLAGREQTIETRRHRAAVSAQYWQRATRYGRFIGSLPFVRMVAVTGALAMDNVADSDIDYMIVTEPGRLWLCRAFVVGLVRVGAARGVTLCPNYFLSERALVIDEKNLFTAHEVTQMVPVFGSATYARFRELNHWTAGFLPNAVGNPRRITVAEPRHPGLRAAAEFALRSPLGSGIEHWERSRKVRKLGRRGDGHTEAAFGPDWCKGHFDDHGQVTLARYSARLEALEQALT